MVIRIIWWTFITGVVYYLIIPFCKWIHYYSTLCKRDGVDSYQLAIEKNVAFGTLNYNGRKIRVKVDIKTKPGLKNMVHVAWNLYDFGSAMFDETIKAANVDSELIECNYIYTDKGEFNRV